jgi:hypothetical protein
MRNGRLGRILRITGLAAGALLAGLTVAAPGDAATSPLAAPLASEAFTEASYHLGTCGFNRNVLMSADATTAVWGGCSITYEGGEWKKGPKFLEEFQQAVAMSGDGLTLVTSSNEHGMQVYTRASEQEEWTLQATLLAPIAYHTPNVALSADGDLLLAMRYKTKTEGKGKKAKVTFEPERYAWERNGESWEAVAAPEVGCDNPEVALSGSGEVAMLACSGEAQAFERTGTTWTKQGAPIVGPSLGGYLAFAADGETAIFGDPFANKDKGEVSIFVHSGGGWKQQGPPILEPVVKHVKAHNLFGARQVISGDGDVALVAAPGILEVRRREGSEPPKKYGAVYVLERSGESWSVVQTLTPFTPERSDEFGRSLALGESGESALIARHGDLDVFTR